MKRVSTKDMSREDWLDLRKKSIGGSDAAALIGMNPWKSLYELYFEKMGVLEEKETNEAMRQGSDFEQYVAERYMEATGKKVQRTNFMYFDEEYDFMSANIDREIVGENAAVECKTMNSMYYNSLNVEGGNIPPQYIMQCQWYMMVRGYDYIDIAILVYGTTFIYGTIPRDEEVIAKLRQAAIEFWINNIMTETPPEPDGSESSMKVLKALYPTSDECKEVPLGENEQLLLEYEDATAIIKRMESRKDEIQARIIAHMGDAAIATGDNWQVSYKSQARTSVDSKALKEKHPAIYDEVSKTSSYRVFRTKVLK